MSQAFYRKWRPQRWDQVVGQEHVVHTLQNAITSGRVAHAYLFAGARGTGKTTTARLLAKAVNCLEEDTAARPCDQCEHCLAVNQGRFLDLIEIDAASNTSVEDVRDLRDKINFSPNQGRYKVYIVDEVHMLSTAAFNALLKTLEEPPSHAIFVLATTEVHKIPATVLSRCQRHEFRRIPVNDIVSHLKEMGSSEGLELDEEALQMVARQATGSLRDAISLLDQLASTGKRVTLENTQAVLGTAASQAVLEVVESVLQENHAGGLDSLHQALDSGSDPRQLARQIVEYLRGLLMVRMNNAGQVEAGPETRAVMARHAQAFSTAELLSVIRVFNQAATEARLSWQPSLPLELAFIESVEKRGSGEAEAPAHAARQPQAALVGSGNPRKAAPPPAERQNKISETLYQEGAGGEEAALAETPDGGLSMDLVNQHWPLILREVRQRNPGTQGLLNSCKPVGVKDGVLILAFNSDTIKDKMEKVDHIEITQQVLAQVFRFEIPVRCIVASTRRGAPPPDIDSDGMVATALRDLGGEIVDIQ